jgi:hypothetical protein
MAEDTLFIVAVCLLKAFDISPAKDAAGNEIPVTGSHTVTNRNSDGGGGKTVGVAIQ